MKEVKIIHVKRFCSNFSEAEKEINAMLEEGWELISVCPDPLRSYKLVATFVRKIKDNQ